MNLPEITNRLANKYESPSVLVHFQSICISELHYQREVELQQMQALHNTSQAETHS